MEGWRFLIFFLLLPLLCTLSPMLCPLESLWGHTVCTSPPHPAPAFSYVSLSSQPALLLTMPFLSH